MPEFKICVDSVIDTLACTFGIHFEDMEVEVERKECGVFIVEDVAALERQVADRMEKVDILALIKNHVARSLIREADDLEDKWHEAQEDAHRDAAYHDDLDAKLNEGN